MSELPLNQRVAAPTVVEHPENTDGLEWCSATVDDVSALVDCEREIGAADHPHYLVTSEEFEDDFSHSYVDLAADTLVAVDAAGVVQAWGIALLPEGQDTLVRSILAGGVRPSARGRGIGRQLLAWQQQRGLQQLASSAKTVPGWLLTFVDERVDATRRLYERFDFTPARYFLELGRDLSEPVPEVTVDPELRIENFTAEWSERTRIARNDAFRDHWGSQPATEEVWNSFVGRSVSRPDLSFLAIGRNADGAEEVAGFVIASVNEEDWPGQGFSSAYVDLVGVTRAWRRRGIAPALLARSLAATAAHGLDKSVLDVDSDSPTGALGLYTGLGFVESHRSISYTRVF